jgi:hypothetical protein
MNRRKLKEIIRESIEESGWENLPDGWDEESVESFARSLTGKTKSDSEGFFTTCMEKVEDKFDEPEKFCASLKDSYLDSTDWRGESTIQKSNMKITESKLRSIVREELETYMPPREVLGDENVMRHKLYDYIESLEEREMDRHDIIKTAAVTIYSGIPKEYYRDIVNLLQNETK